MYMYEAALCSYDTLQVARVWNLRLRTRASILAHVSLYSKGMLTCSDLLRII
jgi:hypothetical protein